MKEEQINDHLNYLEAVKTALIPGYDVVDAGPKLISFTINGGTYQAEEGMTWEKWIASTYNTSGMGNDLVYNTYVLGEDDDAVEWTDELEVNLNDLIESTEYTTFPRAH